MKGCLIAVFLLSCSMLNAQTIVKEFYDKDGKPTDEQNSYYYRTGERALVEMKIGKDKRLDTAFIDTVKTFYSASNKIRSREYYLAGLREGAFMSYHENGRLKDKGTYHEERRVGYLTSWYETGVVQRVLKYLPQPDAIAAFPRDSFQVINYWSEANVQLVKNGSGYCACYLNSDLMLEKGKVVSGAKDSIWQYFVSDTLKHEEKFASGKFLEGKSYYKGKVIRYKQLETMAEFTGGLQAMYKFLSKNVHYPSQARRRGVEGKVFVGFIVEKDGRITNLKIFRGVYEPLDDEAIRVIKIMPLWLPGTYRGMPVKSQFVLPVYFKLG